MCFFARFSVLIVKFSEKKSNRRLSSFVFILFLALIHFCRSRIGFCLAAGPLLRYNAANSLSFFTKVFFTHFIYIEICNCMPDVVHTLSSGDARFILFCFYRLIQFTSTYNLQKLFLHFPVLDLQSLFFSSFFHFFNVLCFVVLSTHIDVCTHILL